MLRQFVTNLVRRKNICVGSLETPLNRALGTVDIVFLGLGSMIGGGIYVLTGQIASRITGPAVVLSFIFAGLASALSALSFAEFGTWIPRAGSAYVYIYVCMGEIWAFMIGWNILLEHLIGGAAVARAWSAYADSISGSWISNHSEAYLSFAPNSTTSSSASLWHLFASYPDFVAVLILILVFVFISCGIHSTTRCNYLFTGTNILVCVFIFIAGLFYVRPENWSRDFMPFGPSSIFAGASRCFFAYIGFDAMAVAAEEAANPGRSIPRATIIAMTIVTTVYVALSAVLTLMVPYNLIHPSSAFADAFEQNGLHWAKIVVGIGAMCAMTSTLIGHAFALPRSVYAMADDGLIFNCLGRVNSKLQVPVNAILTFSPLMMILGAFVKLEVLVDLLAVGTLLAYTLVSMCVLLLRYRKISPEDLVTAIGNKDDKPEAIDEVTPRTYEHCGHVPPLKTTRPNNMASTVMDAFATAKFTSKQTDGKEEIKESNTKSKVESNNASVDVSNQNGSTMGGSPHEPGEIIDDGMYRRLQASFAKMNSNRVVYGLILTALVSVIVLSISATYGNMVHHFGVMFVVAASACVLVSVCLVFWFLPQNDFDLQFKVPFVPIVPILSILCNVIMMVSLDPMTWIRLGIWMVIGFGIYFTYGYFHSREANQDGEDISLIQPTEKMKQ